MVSEPYWGMPRLSNFKKLNRVMENMILKYFTKIRNNRYLGNFVVLTQKMKCALQFLHLLEEVKALHWCDLHLKHKAPKEIGIASTKTNQFHCSRIVYNIR